MRGKRFFTSQKDYAAFLKLLGQANERLPARLVGYCLMPNHFHLVLWPHAEGDLGRWMQWLLTSHVRRYHRDYRSSGHVWQGRFKAFPIERDEHLLTVLRYAERNAVCARLVRKAEKWPWSSASAVQHDDAPALDPGPVPRGPTWLDWVNQPLSEAELLAVRNSIARGTPYGSESWQRKTARQLGLEASLNPRGRPRTQLK